MRIELATVDLVILAIYLIVLLVLGFYKGKNKKANADLFLAGRSLRWPEIGFSIFSTNVSPMMLVGFCGVAYSTGIVVSNFEWLAWPFLLLLAMVFVPYYLSTGITTMPQFLEWRFGKRCHTFLSYYSLAAILLIWIGASLFAGGKIIAQITGIPFTLAVVLIALAASSYTVIGGLKAIVRTDVYQSVIIIAASIILTWLALRAVGGVEKLMRSVPAESWHLFRGSDTDYPWYAILLGYPVVGVYYWCTDQTIVQRVLGAKNYSHGQYGALFTSFLKIIMPFIFLFPGVMCFVLYPNLKDPDEAYVTLITQLMPTGIVGLVVAALIAALMNTVASALNSFSTLFSLDVYKKIIRPDADDTKLKSIGQLLTIVSAIAGILVAIIYEAAGKNLFDLIQGLASYLAPPLTTVFLAGVLWRRATAFAAEIILIGGGFLCVLLGALYVLKWPSETFWPPYLLTTFFIFCILMVAMIILSHISKHKEDATILPRLSKAYAVSGEKRTKGIWIGWSVVAIIMLMIYIYFN
jgi:SSS family solute:Na+ symporter